ncbi:MAG: ribosome small subunit-dependent GTPase A [Acidobacteria bacterium]|nr:MAG: ribosome small subunit-dependent GTPase A [Acidobacteriota bacterium]
MFWRQLRPCVLSWPREDTTVSILRWGWNEYCKAVWQSAERDSVVPARVVAQGRGVWRVAGDFGDCLAEAAGKLRLAREEGADWPAVGDWVAVDLRNQGAATTIHEVLPRRSQFVRKMAGKKIAEQVIAANVDLALLVSALDRDFNLRRVERYLAQCWESGAKPAIVLNKADACEETQEKLQEMERVAMGAPVCVISAKTGRGFDELEKQLARGKTIVLLGSSGVGKSTILNRLMGHVVQEVQEVREADSRGRHTTTARQIFVLPGGALLLDTPGLRELQLWDAGEGISQTFSDMETLAAQCRFADCGHEVEPGCAVQAAIAAGTVDRERFENWRKLQREMEFLQRKIDPQARQNEKQRIKQLMRSVKRMYRGRESHQS